MGGEIPWVYSKLPIAFKSFFRPSTAFLTFPFLLPFQPISRKSSTALYERILKKDVHQKIPIKLDSLNFLQPSKKHCPKILKIRLHCFMKISFFLE
jgi:hypothetical protein